MKIYQRIMAFAIGLGFAASASAGLIGPNNTAMAVFYDFPNPQDPDNLPLFGQGPTFVSYEDFRSTNPTQVVSETLIGKGPGDGEDSYRFDIYANGANQRLHARFRAEYTNYRASQFFPTFYSDHDPYVPSLGEVTAQFLDTVKVSYAGISSNPRYTMSLQYRLNGAFGQSIQVDPDGTPYEMFIPLAQLNATMYPVSDPLSDLSRGEFTITEGSYKDQDIEFKFGANLYDEYQWSHSLLLQAGNPTPAFWAVEDREKADESYLNGVLNFEFGGTASLDKIIFGFAPDVDLSKVSVEFGSGFGYNVEFVTNAAIPEPSSCVLGAVGLLCSALVFKRRAMPPH